MITSHSEAMDVARAVAHTYANWGWNIFPCHSITQDGQCSCKKTDCSNKGKHPAVKWSSMKTTDHIKIDNWWAYSVNYVPNIGIATGQCSGITVIDIDPRHEGEKTWENVCANVDIPDTYTVKTGSGGWHLYFKYCPDLKTMTNAFGAGVDIRNDGGYVIAPPSNHVSGGVYSCLSPSIDLISPSACLPKLAAVPPALLKLIKAPVKDVTPNTASLDKVKRLLDFISSEDYDTWFKTGIILGSAFKRSEEAWAVYSAWSDKGWDKKDPKKRNATMRDAFYSLSQQDNPNGKNLSIKTLYMWAYSNGYTDVTNNFDANLFCYLASENVFIFMPTGEKWLASGVNNTIKPIKDEGTWVKPSQWLANNKAAVSMITDGSIPYGLIEGYYSKEGRLFALPQTRVLNLFNFNDFAPLRPLKPTLEPIPQNQFAKIQDEHEQLNSSDYAAQQTPLTKPAYQAAAVDTTHRAPSQKVVFNISPDLWQQLNS